VVVAAGITLAAAVVFAGVTSTDLLSILTGPLELSRHAVGAGAADLMTLLTLTPWFDGDEPLLTAIGVGAAVVLTAVVARHIRSGDWVFGLGVGAVVSLLCLKHLSHDLVFLLPVVVLVLRTRGRRAAAMWAVLAWHGFGVGILSQLGTPIDTPAVLVVSFLSLAALFVLLVTDRAVLAPDRRVPVSAAAAPDVEETAAG
jgi:hypothetical protein